MAKILIACEESQTVCKAFRNLGHEAYSCDIQDCSGGHPEWHIKGDCIPLLNEDWDLIIAHPPCTYLSGAGRGWFDISKYGEKALERYKLRDEAIDFFMKFTNLKCPKVCIENPVGFMNTYYRSASQIIQPYMFGDPYKKRTCLWLKGLPKLIPTNVVEPTPDIVFKSGRHAQQWFASVWGLPAEERRKIRSKTFNGIAEAMANQWGKLLI